MPLPRGCREHEDGGPLPDGQRTRLFSPPEGGGTHPSSARARGPDPFALQRSRGNSPRPMGWLPRRYRLPPLVAPRNEEDLLPTLPRTAPGSRAGRDRPLQRHLERVPAARGRGGGCEALRGRACADTPARSRMLREAHALRGAGGGGEEEREA